MPREFSRSQRMAEQIRRDLSEIVRQELKDPRMGFCSFTEVRLSRDMSHAVVFCSVLDEASQQETIETLNHAGGFLRSQIAARLSSRIVPALKFVLDDSAMRGEAMDDLIKKARRDDVAREQRSDPHASGADNTEASDDASND